MLYLEDAYPDVKLLPADLDTRAKVLQRLLEADVLLKSGVNAFRWKLFNMIKSEADEATYIQECKKLKPELDRWEAYLTSQFLVGDTFTLADAAVGTALGQFKRCGLDFSKWPKLKSYLETVEARPSFVATFPPHWKETPDNTSLAPVTQE